MIYRSFKVLKVFFAFKSLLELVFVIHLHLKCIVKIFDVSLELHILIFESLQLDILLGMLDLNDIQIPLFPLKVSLDLVIKLVQVFLFIFVVQDCS